MTRRTNRVALTAILAAFLLSLGTARADALFNPTQYASTLYPYYSYGSQLAFDQVAGVDKAMTIKSYDIKIPTGWHVASASPDPSTQSTCAGITGPIRPTDTTPVERVGVAQISLITDAIRGNTTGALTLGGFLYHLSYDSVTDTSTLCGRVSTTNTALPAANREIMFQALLKHNGDGSGNLTWDYATVPGAAPGARAIFDNDFYRDQHVSILATSMTLYGKTAGNFNRDPSGAKAGVPYASNPDTTGTYTITGTYTPCGSGDTVGTPPAPFCSSSATPAAAVRTSPITISDYPVGFHPLAKITAPAMWEVVTSPDPTAIKWSQPATASNDKIKGYALTLTGDYIAGSKRSFLFITDPLNPAYVAADDPCAPNGTAASCTFNLNWTGLLSDTGAAVNPNATFTSTLVTVYQDGHRSDGKCDEGTTIPERVAGKAAPCSDYTVPAYDQYSYTITPPSYNAGVAYAQFLHRSTAWPLRYRKMIKQGNTPSSDTLHKSQVYVLLADLDLHKFEYVVWKPAGVTWAGAGNTVNGTNAGGGQINYSVLSGPVHWTLQAVLNPSDARGLFLQTSSTNDPQSQDLFTGQPFPANSGQMTKV